MQKIDLRKDLKAFYSSKKDSQLIDVPEMSFLMVDGKGYPGTSQEYSDSIQALYNVSYTLRFMFKLERNVDFPVMALEGLWWNARRGDFPCDPEDWRWTSMLLEPDLVNEDDVQRAREKAKEKDLAALSKLRFERFKEGLCAQILHIGPYSEERPTIERLHQFIEAEGYEKRGKHHEIYLSDPRRSKPENLKTIIRQPVIRI